MSFSQILTAIKLQLCQQRGKFLSQKALSISYISIGMMLKTTVCFFFWLLRQICWTRIMTFSLKRQKREDLDKWNEWQTSYWYILVIDLNRHNKDIDNTHSTRLTSTFTWRAYTCKREASQPNASRVKPGLLIAAHPKEHAARSSIPFLQCEGKHHCQAVLGSSPLLRGELRYLIIACFDPSPPQILSSSKECNWLLKQQAEGHQPQETGWGRPQPYTQQAVYHTQRQSAFCNVLVND